MFGWHPTEFLVFLLSIERGGIIQIEEQTKVSVLSAQPTWLEINRNAFSFRHDSHATDIEWTSRLRERSHLSFFLSLFVYFCFYIFSKEIEMLLLNIVTINISYSSNLI